MPARSDHNGTTEEVAEAKESAAEVGRERGVPFKGQSDGWNTPLRHVKTAWYFLGVRDSLGDF